MKKFASAILLVAATSLSGCGFLSIKDNLDPKAMDVYSDLYDKFVESGGDLGAATVWRMEVQKGVTTDDIAEALKSASLGTGLLDVGQMPLSQEIEARTGEKQRYLHIYQFCNPITARKATDFSPYFSAYLPCRISVVEDEKGTLWLYSLNMDMFVHGGRNMPEEFKKDALHVRNTIWNMMVKASKGEF
ncbi:MAG: DUF302 domain-containing protein [Halothiobacillaceae bacterium]|jgi:uncharacterized protein (DUF302 family)|nr:DUF302 domain-containing protein [Halothiobacillaceae bacterium]